MKLTIGVVTLFVAGCSSGAGTPESTSLMTQAVIGGVETADADDGVLILRTDRAKDTSVCSASLIAPNLLLTARHCIVAEYPADNIRCKSDGTLTLPSGGQLGASSPPEKVHVFAGKHPSEDPLSGLPGGEPVALATQILATDWPSVCRDDLALIVLDRELPLPLVPLDLSQVVSKTTRVSVVGYGLTEASAEADRWSPRRRRERVPVKYVDTLPSTFALGRSVCKGDSGGPALDAESGAIVGVYSLGFPGETTADCSSENALNYFAQVNHYPELLRQGFEAAGQAFPEILPSSGGGGANDAGGAGGTPDIAEPAGGEPSTTGGASSAGSTSSAGEKFEDKPMTEGPAEASGGCQFSGRPGSGTALAMLLGLVALSRRRPR